MKLGKTLFLFTVLSVTPIHHGASMQSADLHVRPERLREMLTELAQIGQSPEGGVSRPGFSDADRIAREWVTKKMKEAGLEVWVDQAANIHGRRSGSDPSLPAILFGSHIDTVPQGGSFDGALGSLSALEVLLSLEETGTLTRHPIEMVVWSNEEGVHYGKGIFGSRAATVGPDPGELDEIDDEGVPLSAWLRRYGLDPDQIHTARLDAADYRAFLELHVEQGSVLHRRGIPIGVVQGIVGIRRYEVTLEGAANHAGTTPMTERRDAMLAAARLIQAVREEVMAKPGAQVGNVGWLRASPGAPNVVPGLVRMPIELRDLKAEVMDDMIARIRLRADAIASETGVTISIRQTADDQGAPTDPIIQDIIEKVTGDAGWASLRMPSGAGHDAQALGRLGIPMGMIFVPSKDGISHSPKEWTEWDDCARGAEVLYRTVLALDGR